MSWVRQSLTIAAADICAFLLRLCVPRVHTLDAMQTELTATTGIPEALDAWHRERIRLGTKPANAKKQATRLRTLARERGWASVADLTRSSIVAALTDMAEAGASPATVATMQSQISGFTAFLAESGALNFNPCASIPKTKRSRGTSRRRGVRAFTDDEIRRVVAAAEADETSPNPRSQIPRSRLYRVAALTGARYGQLVRALTWADVDLDAGAITFDCASAKNGEGATLPLHPEAAALLRAMRTEVELAGPTDFVFPRHVQDRVVDIDLRAAGIPKRDASGRSASFHSFRKAFATALVARGVPVNVAQRLMQHKTLQMTLQVYAEVRDGALAEGLSGLQVFGGADLRHKREKKTPEDPEDVLTSGDFVDSVCHAVRRTHESDDFSPRASPRRTAFTDGASGDESLSALVGDNRPTRMTIGGSSPPLGIPQIGPHPTTGDTDEVPPTVLSVARVLAIVARSIADALEEASNGRRHTEGKPD